MRWIWLALVFLICLAIYMKYDWFRDLILFIMILFVLIGIGTGGKPPKDSDPLFV